MKVAAFVLIAVILVSLAAVGILFYAGPGKATLIPIKAKTPIKSMLQPALTPVISRPATPLGCTVPTNGMIITQSTTFCPGTYTLPDGIRLHGNNILLDCNGATLDHGATSGYNSKFGIITSPYGWGGWTNFSLNKFSPTYYHSKIEIKNCNIINYDFGINIFLTEDAKIHHNSVTNFRPEGISIMDSGRVQVYENFVKDGETSGIRFYDTKRSTAKNNRVENVGIFTITGGPEPMTTCLLGAGIWFDGLITTHNEAIDNVLDHNCWGVHILPNQYSPIPGTQPFYSTIQNNRIARNTIKNSVLYGIYTDTHGYGSGSMNTFMRNNFINNQAHALDVWNNTYERNYWGPCIDANNDGICDSPTPVPVSNIDPTPSAQLN